MKDYHNGRKYLEKHSLICPPSELATHQSLSVCLHQISALLGIPKQVINAIRSVVFLLDELKDIQISQTIKEAFDCQLDEYTSDMQKLIIDAKEQICDVLRQPAEPANPPRNLTPTNSTSTPLTNSYITALINPPPHANPILAAHEGIKARQFALSGFNNSKISHLNHSQIKSLLNNILLELDLTSGKIRSVTSARDNGIIVETDNNTVLSYDLPGSFQNGKYAENNSGQERTKSGTLPVTDKDLASTYVLCCPSPTCP